MIKITGNIKDEYDNGKLQDLFDEIDSVLQKREAIQERYLRGINSTTAGSEGEVQVFFEKFITDLAAGYLSGDVTYNVEIVDPSEEPAYRILHPSSSPLDPDTAAQLKYILSTLSSKNDDPKVLKALFHDAVLYGACYERELDLATNDIVGNSSSFNSSSSSSSNDPNYTYYPLSALNTVAIFPTDISDIQQQNAIALVTVYTLDARNAEDNQDHTLYYCIECNPYTNNYSTSIYDQTTNQDATSEYQTVITLKEEKQATHNIPTFSVFEPDPQVSIIDPIISLVSAYEDIMNNLNNMYQYNDTDAKLMVSGYRPENPLTIPNPNYNPEEEISDSNSPSVTNPARTIEDDYLINSRTFFVQEGGKVEWLLKEINAEDATKYLKYYVDSIFQISGIPNTNDAAFNSGDLNASAIDRKFYTMALMLDDVRQGVTALMKHRWSNFLARINLLSSTYYDINDVNIEIGTNLPSMTDETINQQLALNGILSQKTLLSNLGYDYATEMKNKQQEVADGVTTTTDDNSASTSSSNSSSNTAASTDTALTTSQTNNQIEAATQTTTTETVTPDRTDNIHSTQTREGRPNI